MVTTRVSLVASRPQMLMRLCRYATKGKRNAVSVGLARAVSSESPKKKRPLCNGLGLGKSSSKYHVTSDMPESHIWYSDSAVQRAASLSDAAFGRGGCVSQPNS